MVKTEGEGRHPCLIPLCNMNSCDITVKYARYESNLLMIFHHLLFPLCRQIESNYQRKKTEILCFIFSVLLNIFRSLPYSFNANIHVQLLYILCFNTIKDNGPINTQFFKILKAFGVCLLLESVGSSLQPKTQITISDVLTKNVIQAFQLIQCTRK